MGGSGLTLFVTGDAPRSERARSNLARGLEAAGRDPAAYTEVDLLTQPDRVFELGILATPALVHQAPGSSPAILYGDLSDSERLHRFLDGLAAS